VPERWRLSTGAWIWTVWPAPGGRDELADGAVGLVLDPSVDGEDGEHDGQVGLYGGLLPVVTGLA
jgi:hypothetical protein